MARNFDRAHDFHIDNFNVLGAPPANPLESQLGRTPEFEHLIDSALSRA
jgi:hypothetical protein